MLKKINISISSYAVVVAIICAVAGTYLWMHGYNFEYLWRFLSHQASQ